MTTTTNVEQVKLNIMTTSQYDNSSKSDTELYVLTDATAMPMDDELSLSSENPVKNSVITARSNAIQVELDDKLNKSTVWNKLNRAYGWTYRHLNGAGNAYFIYGNTDAGFGYSDAYSGMEIIENQTLSDISYGNQYYVCIDKQLYYRTYNSSTHSFTLTPKLNNNCTCYASNTTNSSGYCAIVDNNLYRNETLRDSGGWTKISGYDGLTSTSSGYYGLGIKNGNLYFINSSSIMMKDGTGTWTDIVGYVNNTSTYAAGIKDNKLYSIGNNDIIELSSESGWSQLRGIDSQENFYQILLLKNKKIYYIENRTLKLLEGTNDWIKLSGSTGNGASVLALTQDGKLYRSHNGNDSTRYMSQLGTDNSWSDIAGTGFRPLGIKNGDVYLITNVNNYTETKLTSFGNITNVYGDNYLDSDIPMGIFWTGSVTEDVHNVYTIASPSVGFNTYSNTNLQQLGTITAASSSPYTITDQFYTYTRDASIDGVFSNISPDSSKQLMSMSDFLQCFTE